VNTRGRRGIFFVSTVVVTGIICWVVFALSMRDEDTSSSRSSGTRDIVQQYDPGERTTVAAFDAELLNGSRLSSASLRGGVTVINVWGSWCGPCRAEAPELVEATRKLSQSAQFYGINVRDSPDAARAFERAFDIPYPSIHPDDSAEAILAEHGGDRRRWRRRGSRGRSDRCSHAHRPRGGRTLNAMRGGITPQGPQLRAATSATVQQSLVAHSCESSWPRASR
jgi:thiol-disulfide isomerase/thioredoxin